MTSRPAGEAEAACLRSLERGLAEASLPDLAGYPAPVVDAALRDLISRHGAAVAPLLRAIADHGPTKPLRKTARLAIYRLGRAGVAVK